MLKTHCKRGHEFTPENSFRKDDGHRGCLTCRRIRGASARRARGVPEKEPARTVADCECGNHSFRAIQSGYVALVDCQDRHLLERGGPSASVNGRNIYVIVKRKSNGWKNKKLHREIMDAPSHMLVDHINSNGLDNRRSNLRLATISQNQRNRRSNAAGRSVYLGVSWHSSKSLWRAYIQSDGKLSYIGTFADEIAAALAYDEKAMVVHGEFARLNFPKKNAAASG